MRECYTLSPSRTVVQILPGSHHTRAEGHRRCEDAGRRRNQQARKGTRTLISVKIFTETKQNLMFGSGAVELEPKLVIKALALPSPAPAP